MPRPPQPRRAKNCVRVRQCTCVLQVLGPGLRHAGLFVHSARALRRPRRLRGRRVHVRAVRTSRRRLHPAGSSAAPEGCSNRTALLSLSLSRSLSLSELVRALSLSPGSSTPTRSSRRTSRRGSSAAGRACCAARVGGRSVRRRQPPVPPARQPARPLRDGKCASRAGVFDTRARGRNTPRRRGGVPVARSSMLPLRSGLQVGARRRRGSSARVLPRAARRPRPSCRNDVEHVRSWACRDAPSRALRPVLVGGRARGRPRSPPPPRLQRAVATACAPAPHPRAPTAGRARTAPTPSPPPPPPPRGGPGRVGATARRARRAVDGFQGHQAPVRLRRPLRDARAAAPRGGARTACEIGAPCPNGLQRLRVARALGSSSARRRALAEARASSRGAQRQLNCPCLPGGGGGPAAAARSVRYPTARASLTRARRVLRIHGV